MFLYALHTRAHKTSLENIRVDLDRKVLFTVNCSHLYDSTMKNLGEAISSAVVDFVVSIEIASHSRW